jgi:hypothetical protein
MSFDAAARIALSGRRITRRGGSFGRIDLGFVSDVANSPRLGAGTVQGALGTLKHLDALEIGGIDIEIATWQLS